MDIVTSFITPNVAALIVAITGILGLIHKFVPKIKDNKIWWKLLPIIPLILGVGFAFLPGVVPLQEGQTMSTNWGNILIIGVACAGLATIFRNGIKRFFKDKFEER